MIRKHMEYIINDSTASQSAWIVWVLVWGVLLLKPIIKLFIKARKLNKRWHILSYGDMNVFDYEDEDED